MKLVMLQTALVAPLVIRGGERTEFDPAAGEAQNPALRIIHHRLSCRFGELGSEKAIGCRWRAAALQVAQDARADFYVRDGTFRVLKIGVKKGCKSLRGANTGGGFGRTSSAINTMP